MKPEKGEIWVHQGSLGLALGEGVREKKGNG
jgi:hypothetical protein